MSNDLVRTGRKALMTSDSDLREKAGKGLVVTGIGGLGLWFLAGMLPFITLPMLLVFAVVAGLFL